MKKVKILHCGDLHFDTPFRGLSATEGEKRKEDLRETFGKIIEMVKEEDIQLLLISGDFFDNGRVMKTTLDYLMKKFQEIPNTYVFISPGNHDPYGEKSFYHVIYWPENVHVFKNHMERVKIPKWNTSVYGIGFSKHHERESLIKNFCTRDDEDISIMVIHGDIVGKGQESDYNPITIEQIESTNLDYLALGHRHGYSGLKKDGKTYWSYSGNPEGRGFDETGSKGVLMGEVGKNYCHLQFHETAKRKYVEERIDITGARTYEEIIGLIHGKIGDNDKNIHLYKIVLIGAVSEDFPINKAVVEEKLKNSFYFVKIVDDTKVEMDYDTLERTFSLKGIFVKKMREKIAAAKDDDERKKMEYALKMGITALDDGEVAAQ